MQTIIISISLDRRHTWIWVLKEVYNNIFNQFNTAYMLNINNNRVYINRAHSVVAFLVVWFSVLRFRLRKIQAAARSVLLIARPERFSML